MEGKRANNQGFFLENIDKSIRIGYGMDKETPGLTIRPKNLLSPEVSGKKS